MGNFTVSLKKLTEKVSMDVVYTPQVWKTSVLKLQRSTVRACSWRVTMIILISCVCRSWAWRR